MDNEKLQEAQKRADKIFLEGFGIKIDVVQNAKLPLVNIRETNSTDENSIYSIMKPLLEQFKKDVAKAKTPREIEELDIALRQKIKPRIQELVNKHSILPDNTGSYGSARYAAGALINFVETHVLGAIGYEMGVRIADLKPFSEMSSSVSTKETSSAIQHIKNFLQSQDQSYYMQNVRPLFPTGNEPKGGMISSPDLQKLFEGKGNQTMMSDIASNLNDRQFPNRIVNSINANPELKKSMSKDALRSFDEFEKRVNAINSIKNNKVHESIGSISADPSYYEPHKLTKVPISSALIKGGGKRRWINLRNNKKIRSKINNK